ncbi:hypothetical protein CDAR_499131 [Caerostris darwini]|uniref:Uncharacterized protein n=1 Tax=Caerostris darwini TaxID=1538125 RepID=A0AAV4TNA4_9ARAC|nr:hypothetical protein CDAR_499131 [Caerostris darwini]
MVLRDTHKGFPLSGKNPSDPNDLVLADHDLKTTSPTVSFLSGNMPFYYNLGMILLAAQCVAINHVFPPV